MLKFPKHVFQTLCRCFEYSTVTKIDPLSRAALSHFDQGEKPLRNVLRRALSVRGKYKRPASVVFGLSCFKSCTPFTVGSRKSWRKSEVGSRKFGSPKSEVRSRKSLLGVNGYGCGFLFSALLLCGFNRYGVLGAEMWSPFFCGLARIQ